MALWFRAGAALILVAELAYLLEGLRDHRLALLSLHILNLAAGFGLLGAMSTRWFKQHWPIVVLSACGTLIASTTVISLVTGQKDPRFGTILLILLGTSALAPWSVSWQLSLELLGVGCFAAGNSFGFYAWVTLILAIVLAHCAVALNRTVRQRLAREIEQSRKSEAQLKEKLVELEQSERRVRANAEMVQKIIDASPESISINRYSDGTYIRLIDSTFRESGYKTEDVRGKSSYKLGFWADKAEYKQYLTKLAERGRVRNMEVKFRNAYGNVVPMLLSSTVAELNGEKAIVSFTRDLTRIKEAERKIRESEVALRKIIDSSPDPIMITRLSDGRILDINGALLDTLLVEREHVLSKTLPELGIISGDAGYRQFVAELRAEGSVRNLEVEFVGTDGRQHPTLLSAAITELGGEPCAIAIARDITALKETERQLESAREAALEAARTKSEFLSNMSHEIRTPMNAIIGTAELLSETNLTDDQRCYLEIMKANGDALIDLINGILDLAKIESGRMTIESTEFNLEELVDRLGEMMAIRAHEKRLELVMRIAPEVPVNLIGDGLRLRQILINLIGNAIKFTDHGEVVIEVERADSDHRGQLNGRLTTLRFTVRDTGIGIESSKLGVIFSSFAQADSSTTRKYGGSGLGLAIVKRLVELYGGEISVESEPGRGSRFIFTISFGLGIGIATPAGMDPVPTANLDGVRVLSVDDTIANRTVLREILTNAGARVHEASSGEEALAELGRAARTGDAYRLVVLDWRMPGIDGFEVIKLLQQQYGHGRGLLPSVLMLTSEDLPARLARLRDLGVKTYLVKPVRRSELLNAVARALNAVPDEPRTIPSSAIRNEHELPPMRVLLADDSAANRMLVRDLLKGSPLQIDEAPDGQCALDCFKAARYDLVLMDMRMPMMDGYVATKAIRAWEEANRRNPTPVIALTASALDEDVKRCLDSGCNAHVSKPVRRADLLIAIARYGTMSSSDQDHDAERIVVTVDEGLRDLVPAFLDYKRADMEKALEALKQQDCATAREVGHQLKGEGLAYGFERLTEMGRDLEQSAERKDLDAARVIALQISDYLRRVEVHYTSAAA
ncbi:MAG TPA: response regulator [Candidatus Binataceae bacterium]|nr:response regulator [Candidatus Binataceae bacterium]